MTSRRFSPAVALPKGWARHIRSALLQAISLASTALTVARSQTAASRSQRDRLRAELERVNTEIALLKEELDIKDSRWRRSCYQPTQPITSTPERRQRADAAGRASGIIPSGRRLAAGATWSEELLVHAARHRKEMDID